jgi:hypothetical protein
MNRAGFFEQPNDKELRDSKGNFITCYLCGMTANGRDIIPCDYCSAKWHTDCVDPPLAVPPQRRGGDKPTGYWRCPLHVDEDLAAVGRHAEAAPGDLGRLPRLRKPKKTVAVDVVTNRGFRNNGVIEVDLMKDEIPDIKEVMHEHGIYRLPEKGIRLDFIDRVKKSWYEDHILSQQMHREPRIRNRLYRPGEATLHHPPAYTILKRREPDFFRGATAISVAETARANVQLRQKSFREQSAVMSLLGITNSSENQAATTLDPLADLTNALVACAPSDVEDMINASELDRLLRLKELINGRLALLQQNKESGNGPSFESLKQSQKASFNAHMNGAVTQINGDGEGDGDDEDEGDGGSAMDVSL